MRNRPARHAVSVSTNLVVAFTLGACVGSTDVGNAGAPVVGRWSYAATQNSPTPAELQGELTITTQTGSLVSGALDFLETDQRGQQRRVAGPVNGRTVDATTLDFDLAVNDLARRHVGVVRNDSIIGNWIEVSTSGGAISANGTFRSKRLP